MTEEHKPTAVTGQEIRKWFDRIIHIVIDSAAMNSEVFRSLPGRVELFGSYVRFFVSGFHRMDKICANEYECKINCKHLILKAVDMG